MLYAEFTKKLASFELDIHIESDCSMLGIFGASGSGKSMTLKCVAGIERPDKGIIKLNGRTLFDSDKRIDLKPQERRVGYLFQEYALFPNMTVEGNIMAGLHRLPLGERKNTADLLMESFHIAHLSSQRPDSLSGGERQRVALARIFASQPELLLLDEPFSSLDTVLKCELIPEMKKAIGDFGKGCMMVSHDVAELNALCDNVTTITAGNNGDIVPADVFSEDIKNRFDSLNIILS